jgi:aryl-alcohol dehydrogenase-like predicted oxidoreductase
MSEPLLHTRPRYTLGQSGLAFGPIAYGCWRFAGSSVPEAQAKIEMALGCGMTLIDTAEVGS